MKLHDNYDIRILLGDIHGNWSVITQHLKLGIKKACYIQVGDFGIGFRPIDSELERLEELNEELIDNDSHLLIIRGNHDDPSWFDNDNFQYEKSKLSNIFFIQDYSILNINGENILFIGGAVSIDREQRKKRDLIYGTKSYWYDEVVKFDFNFSEDVRNIDRMICHTSPNFCQPIKFNGLVYSYALGDPTLLDELTNERSDMTTLVTNIIKFNNLKGFYNGHFHSDHYFYHQGCEFVTLGINVFRCF